MALGGFWPGGGLVLGLWPGGGGFVLTVDCGGAALIWRGGCEFVWAARNSAIMNKKASGVLGWFPACRMQRFPEVLAFSAMSIASSKSIW